MRGTPTVFSEFKQGVNLKAAPYSLDAGQARNALNVHSGPTGAIVKRYGCQPIATPAEEPTSLYGADISGTPVLLMQAGTKFYKPPLESGSITELESEVTSTAGTQWEFIQAAWEEGKKSAIFGTNGVDEPIYYEGTGKVKKWTGEEIPKEAKYIIYHENRVFMAKGSTLYWSDIVNPFNFKSPDGGSTLVDPEDGQEITGLGKVGSYLLIFKDRKTFLLTDSNNGFYRRISSTIGCASNRSITETEQGTFFLTTDNEICVTDGSSFNINIGERIQPLLSELTLKLKKKVVGTRFGSSVYFSFPTKSSQNDFLLEYSLLNDAWWPHQLTYSEEEKMGIVDFAIADNFTSSALYGISVGSDGETFQFWDMFLEERWTDKEQFPVEWKSPWLVFNLPHVRKRIREVRVDSLNDYEFFAYTSFASGAEEKDFTFWEASSEEANWEDEEDEESWEEESILSWGGEGSIGERRYYTVGVGRAWSFRFYALQPRDLEIYSYTVNYQLRKD